jgi:hypothetical protein
MEAFKTLSGLAADLNRVFSEFAMKNRQFR